MDDASYFLMIRLGPKTTECEMYVIVKSTVAGCEVSNCAATLHGFNKQIRIFIPIVSCSKVILCHRYFAHSLSLSLYLHVVAVDRYFHSSVRSLV